MVGAALVFLSRKSMAEDNIVANTSAPIVVPTETVPADAAPTESAPASAPTLTVETATASAYKNGTYSAVGSYQAPSGQELVGVELVVEDDVITAVTIDQQAVHPTSQKMQSMFASGISGAVVGQRLDQLVGIGKVSGSSLTPKGFNDALVKIKAEAKS